MNRSTWTAVASTTATACSVLAQSMPAVDPAVHSAGARALPSFWSIMVVVLPCCCLSRWAPPTVRDTTAGRSLIGALMAHSPVASRRVLGRWAPHNSCRTSNDLAGVAVTQREPGATDRPSGPAPTPSPEKRSARRGWTSERALTQAEENPDGHAVECGPWGLDPAPICWTKGSKLTNPSSCAPGGPPGMLPVGFGDSGWWPSLKLRLVWEGLAMSSGDRCPVRPSFRLLVTFRRCVRSAGRQTSPGETR